MTATFAALGKALADGPAAVVLVERTKGSTPREAGAWMIVTWHAIRGTIGGGEAERRAVEAARGLLADGGGRAQLELPLGPELDQCCGGHMRLALAPVHQAPRAPFALWEGGPIVAERALRPVIVYGAGHVGAALVTALRPLPFALEWIDARPEAAWPTPIEAPCRRLALPESAAAAAPDAAFHLVMTHSHAVDLEIVAAVLSRRFAYLGLIGSATKRATFARRLRERAIASDGLTCPIGSPGIRGKDPAVIAASVAADLLAHDAKLSSEQA